MYQWSIKRFVQCSLPYLQYPTQCDWRVFNVCTSDILHRFSFFIVTFLYISHTAVVILCEPLAYVSLQNSNTSCLSPKKFNNIFKKNMSAWMVD